jgi:hypothetical protein
VRVLADSAALLGRREFRRTGVIEKEKRAENLPRIGIGKEGPNGKTVADPMTLCSAPNVEELFGGSGLHRVALMDGSRSHREIFRKTGEWRASSIPLNRVVMPAGLQAGLPP